MRRRRGSGGIRANNTPTAVGGSKAKNAKGLLGRGASAMIESVLMIVNRAKHPNLKPRHGRDVRVTTLQAKKLD